MSTIDPTEANAPESSDPGDSDPVGRPVLFPTLRFGANVAALALAAAPAGMLAMGLLSGNPEAIAEAPHTTCCPPGVN